jgi:P-type E1-E2 ATPase
MIIAVIGTIQQFSAQRAAIALQQLVTTHTRVRRESDSHEINEEELVPGDSVMLESGDRIPADLSLLTTHNLELDESLLTGESLPVAKVADKVLKQETFLGDRQDMAFAGSLVETGHRPGIVVASGHGSEFGHIASEVFTRKPAGAVIDPNG